MLAYDTHRMQSPVRPRSPQSRVRLHRTGRLDLIKPRLPTVFPRATASILCVHPPPAWIGRCVNVLMPKNVRRFVAWLNKITGFQVCPCAVKELSPLEIIRPTH